MSKESKCGIKGYRLRLRPRQFADYATMGLAPKELSIWFNHSSLLIDSQRQWFSTKIVFLFSILNSMNTLKRGGQ